MDVYKPSCAGDDRPWTLAYECRPAIDAMVLAIRPFLGTDELIVFRDAFRWKLDDGPPGTVVNEWGNRGSVISNCYECHEMESAAELLDAEIIWDFRHVGVLRKKTRSVRPPEINRGDGI